MTVDFARGTVGCHQIECAEPSPSECVKTASVYAPLSSEGGSIFRRNGGNIEQPGAITVNVANVVPSQCPPKSGCYRPSGRDSALTEAPAEV